MDDFTASRLPNLRDLLIPDEGYTLVDMDLQRADMWVTAWESGDVSFKEQLLEETRDPSKDVHNSACIEIFGPAAYNADGSINKEKRRFAKVFGHGSDYGARPPTLAKQCGVAVSVAATGQAKWFAAHPGIPKWHERVKKQIYETRTIANKFGYRIRFFDRPDSCVNQALAWVPQSTVALVINKALNNISAYLPEVQILLQVHDSLTMQVRSEDLKRLLPGIKRLSLITIPYDEPLVIPVSFAVSSERWGAVKDIKNLEEYCANI